MAVGPLQSRSLFTYTRGPSVRFNGSLLKTATTSHLIKNSPRQVLLELVDLDLHEQMKMQVQPWSDAGTHLCRVGFSPAPGHLAQHLELRTEVSALWTKPGEG